MSDKGMDSESSGEDMEKGKFKKYIKAASDMLVEFEMIYYGDRFKKADSKYQMLNNRSQKLLLKDKKKKIEPVQPIQACLRQVEKKTEHKKL